MDLDLDDQDEGQTVAEAAVIEPSSGPEAEERAYEAAALADDDEENAAIEGAEEPPAGYAPVEPEAEPSLEAPVGEFEPPLEALTEEAGQTRGVEAVESALKDDDFSPFAHRELHERSRRHPIVTLVVVALVIAAIAAAFWFLAPPEWKQKVGIASAGDTPLQLMMTHSDRQKLASGNELLAVTGRVINPTEKSQPVPPIQAQLRSRSGKLVYSWTIAPPARVLPPGASATFNSAEVNVPAGGDELTITLGSKA